MGVFEYFISIVLIVVGPVFASFFAVLVMRGNFLTQNKDPYSACDNCGRKLDPVDLIPLVSYLHLRGKCRYCGSSINPALFWSEVLGFLGFLFIATFISMQYAQGIPAGTTALLVYGFSAVALLYLAIHDLFTFSIPARVTEILVGIAVVLNLVLAGLTAIGVKIDLQILGRLDSLWGGLLGLVFLGSIVLYTKGKGMGSGDVYIAVLMGLLLGWQKLVIALYVMLFTASLVGLIMAWREGKFKGLRIPLVPFMFLGYCLALPFGEIFFKFLFPTL